MSHYTIPGVQSVLDTDYNNMSVLAKKEEESMPVYSLSSNISILSSGSPGEDECGTLFNIQFNEPTGHRIFLRAKLDTGARRNAIAQCKANELNLKIFPCERDVTFINLGTDSYLKPIGYIAPIFNVLNMNKIVQGKKFYVLRDQDVRKAFDCLFGCALSSDFLQLRPELHSARERNGDQLSQRHT